MPHKGRPVSSGPIALSHSCYLILAFWLPVFSSQCSPQNKLKGCFYSCFPKTTRAIYWIHPHLVSRNQHIRNMRTKNQHLALKIQGKLKAEVVHYIEISLNCHSQYHLLLFWNMSWVVTMTCYVLFVFWALTNIQLIASAEETSACEWGKMAVDGNSTEIWLWNVLLFRHTYIWADLTSKCRQKQVEARVKRVLPPYPNV